VTTGKRPVSIAEREETRGRVRKKVKPIRSR
jgi:hypothetical protein